MFKSLTTIFNEPDHTSYATQGFKTGFLSLDSGLGGISDSELVLIAAKPGNWSSILMLNLAVGLSSRYPVLFISTAKCGPVVAHELKSVLLPGNEPRENDEESLNELNRLSANIFIEDESRFLEDIEQSIARFRSEYPADAIVLIDDLNNIFFSKEIITYPRSQAEGEIASNLKMLTLKYNIPVLLLSKIGFQEPLKRHDPPTLRDLEHLMGLNCHFGKIIGVHLCGYNRTETDENCVSTQNNLFLNILKNDRGKRGVFRLYMSEFNRFRLQDECQIQIT